MQIETELLSENESRDAQPSVPGDSIEHIQSEVRNQIPFDCSKIVAQWNADSQYHIESQGEAPFVVILGESHDDKVEMQKQEELIAALNSDYVLHEFGGAFQYSSSLQYWGEQAGRGVSPNDSPGVPRRFVELANEKGFDIIGCDLTQMEQDRSTERRKKARGESYDKNRAGLYFFDDESIAARDVHMAEKIAYYRKLSNKPIVVILGARHGRNILSQNLLAQKKIGCILIDQLEKKEREQVSSN
ncbi:MAG: hypothetical protein WCG83_04685 [Candidatus Peregrinibacteria bacterium]